MKTFVRFENDIQVSFAKYPTLEDLNKGGLDGLGYMEVDGHEDGDIWKLVSGTPTKMTYEEKTAYLNSKAQEQINLRSKKDLLIYEYIGKLSDTEIKNTDFTIIGLQKAMPEYVQGRKIRADYISPIHNKVAVRKVFADKMGNHKVWNGVAYGDVAGIIGLDVTFEWLCDDGSVGLSKVETVKALNVAEEETVLRKRRFRSIDYLVASAKGTAAAPLVKALFDHYADKIITFKEQGTNEFKDALQNETNATILAHLNILIPKPDGKKATIRNNILFQIGAITYAQYVATFV